MKKIIFILFMAFGISNGVQGSRICPLHHKQSWYTAYYCIKEGLYARCILPLWLNFKRAKRAQAACDNCNQTIDSLQMYTYLMLLADSDRVALLKLYWENKDRADLEHFMVYNLRKFKIDCVNCSAYHGWHGTYQPAH